MMEVRQEGDRVDRGALCEESRNREKEADVVSSILRTDCGPQGDTARRQIHSYNVTPAAHIRTSQPPSLRLSAKKWFQRAIARRRFHDDGAHHVGM
jgi:hypothetical protein